MPTKIHAHLAQEKVLKDQTEVIIAETAKNFKAGEEQSTFMGLTKNYTPKDENGMRFEPVVKEIITTVPDRVLYTMGQFEKLFDWLMTRDEANTRAFADIIVKADGKEVVLATKVPVDTIIEGKKILARLRDLLKAAPCVDGSHKWEPEGRPHIQKYGPVIKYQREKRSRAVTMTKATDKHPETYKEVVEDIIVGEWNTMHTSGMLTSATKMLLLQECENLIVAFNEAQTRANETLIAPQSIGAAITARFRTILSA